MVNFGGENYCQSTENSSACYLSCSLENLKFISAEILF